MRATPKTYAIASGNSEIDLTSEVQQYLADGFDLWCGPFCSTTKSYSHDLQRDVETVWFYQAVVKD